MIHKSLRSAVGTFHRDDPIRAREEFGRLVGAATGAAGGFFGLPGLLVELPNTTTLIMRAIADIARSEGEDVHDSDALRACIEVFALGARAESDDAVDTGYDGVRLALATYTSSLAAPVAGGGMPRMFGLVNSVSSRFGVTVSQRLAVQLVPVVGAAGSATVNVIFIYHFQDTARHHCAIRRLERKYGTEVVRANYESLSGQQARSGDQVLVDLVLDRFPDFAFHRA